MREGQEDTGAVLLPLRGHILEEKRPLCFLALLYDQNNSEKQLFLEILSVSGTFSQKMFPPLPHCFGSFQEKAWARAHFTGQRLVMLLPSLPKARSYVFWGDFLQKKEQLQLRVALQVNND